MSVASPGRARLATRALCVSPLVVFSLFYVVWANDGRLYWHDVRYLYATAHYSLAELFAGVWNPQYGEALDPAASGGFYLVKSAWLAVLEAIFALRPAEHGGYEAAVALSLALGVASAWVTRSLCNRLARPLEAVAPGREPLFGQLAAVLLLVSPALLWLGGKLLAEALALPAALLCCTCLLRRDGRAASPLGLAGAAAIALHALTVAARPNFGALAPAMCLALAWTSTRTPAGAAAERRAWLGWAAELVLVQALVHGLLFATLAEPGAFFGYLGEYVAGSRPAVVSLVGGLAAVGALAPLALASLASSRRALRALFGRWLLLGLAPPLAFAALYQIEARYLLPGFVPLAGLAALGLEAIWSGLGRRLAHPRVRQGSMLGGLAVLAALNALCLSLLPDEIDRRALDAIVRVDALEGGRRPLLVPWAYSDYHYLVTLAPGRDVRFVHVPRVQGVLRPYSAEWRARLEAWYGADRLVLDRAALDPLLEDGPVYLLFWGVHPPLERLARRLDAAGLGGVAGRVRSLGGDPHGDQTWIVDEGDLVRIPVAERGLYRLDRLQVESAASKAD